MYNLIIETLKYFALFTGVYLFLISFGLDLRKTYKRIKMSTSQSHNAEQFIKFAIFRKYHLHLTAFKRYELYLLPRIFSLHVVSLICIFASLFIVTHNLFSSIILAFVFSIFLPITLVWLKSYYSRANVEAAIYTAATQLLKLYRRNDDNIYYTLKEISESEGISSHLRHVFARFFIALQGEEHERNLGAEVFSFQLKNGYARNLGQQILRACNDGHNIGNSLNDFIQDMKAFKTKIRQAATEGSEVAVMSWFPIFLLPTFIIFSQFTIPNGQALNYLFLTPDGINIFLFTLSTSIISAILAIVLRKPKQTL